MKNDSSSTTRVNLCTFRHEIRLFRFLCHPSTNSLPAAFMWVDVVRFDDRVVLAHQFPDMRYVQLHFCLLKYLLVKCCRCSMRLGRLFHYFVHFPKRNLWRSAGSWEIPEAVKAIRIEALDPHSNPVRALHKTCCRFVYLETFVAHHVYCKNSCSDP